MSSALSSHQRNKFAHEPFWRTFTVRVVGIPQLGLNRKPSYPAGPNEEKATNERNQGHED
jgi:hypothetical protein